jgi:hypothetical protein
MKFCKWIDTAGLACAMVLAGGSAFAQQPATGGSLIVSAPGALGAASGKPLAGSAPVTSGGTQGEAVPQVAAAETCSADSLEGCSQSEPPRTGLLTDGPAPLAGSASYGALFFSGPSYGGSGGAGISPRTLSASAGGGMGPPAVPFVPGPAPILPGPSILPNICLP